MILDIENPERPEDRPGLQRRRLHQRPPRREAGDHLLSEFAYLADGKNGLRVVQLTSPETPGNRASAPGRRPSSIATFKLPQGGHALAISKGLDRDRAVDESGNQIGVFGRIGARPLNADEQRGSTSTAASPGRSATTPATRSTATSGRPRRRPRRSGRGR